MLKYFKSLGLKTFSIKEFGNGFTLPFPAAALHLSGIWPHTFSWVHCLGSVTSTLLLLFGELSAVHHFWPDVAAECNVGSTIITGVRSVFISLLIGYRKNEFLELINVFVTKIWISKNENSVLHIQTENRILVSNWASVSMFLGLTGYVLNPLIDSDKRNNMEFAFLVIYPFDTKSTVGYCLISTVCIVAGVLGVGSVVGHDTLLNYMLLHTCSRLEILSNRIKTISNRFAKEMIIGDDKYIYKELQNIVETHCELINFSNMMENFFNPHILMHFFGTSILTCILGIQLLLVDLTISERTKLIFYFVTCLGQVYVCCNNGENLIKNSTYISHAMYNINWPELHSKYKLHILMIMQRSQKPLQLTAGKFFNLSMVTFSSILKTAGSYFALLKKFLEDHE